jgi:glycerophosphoryl diester phosphodiesterase
VNRADEVSRIGSLQAMSPTHLRVTHLVAHRGNAAEFPENTLPALRSAWTLGVRFALVDVQLAADEVPVACRDAGLARTAGVDVSVFDLAARELAAIDVSEPGRLGDRHRGTRLPTLADVAASCADRPELTLLLDLQRESLARFGAETVVSRVLEAVRPVRTQCVLVSRDLGIVRLARENAARAGWVLPAYDARARLKYEALRPDFLIVEAVQLPPDGGRLWRGPWRWIVVGVQTAAEAEALAARGADFVAGAAVATLSADLRARVRVS